MVSPPLIIDVGVPSREESAARVYLSDHVLGCWLNTSIGLLAEFRERERER